MSDGSQRFFRTWILCAITAVAAWTFLPGSTLDRWLLLKLAHRHAIPPISVTGAGNAASPWVLHSRSSEGIPKGAPSVVALTDDPHGTFQSSPHAPIDMAVIMTNLQRLGARKLAIGALMAWDAPDPIGLTALQDTLAKFESVAIAAPLTRGAIMEPLPPPFREASIDVADVQGQVSLLPVVNRCSIPNLIFGSGNTVAGFQRIDSEPDGGGTALLARWDERIVLAFPLVAAMQQLGVPIKQLEIHLGQHLRLGPKGPLIPIDAYGRLVLPLDTAMPFFQLGAEQLIDGQSDLIGSHPFVCPLLCDQRSQGELPTLEFNRRLPAAIATLSSGQGPLLEQTLKRFGAAAELFLLLMLALMLAMLAALGNPARLSVQALLAAACAAIQSEALGRYQYWLPGLVALFIILIAIPSAWSWRRRRRTTSAPRLDRIDFAGAEKRGECPIDDC